MNRTTRTAAAVRPAPAAVAVRDLLRLLCDVPVNAATSPTSTG